MREAFPREGSVARKKNLLKKESTVVHVDQNGNKLIRTEEASKLHPELKDGPKKR